MQGDFSPKLWQHGTASLPSQVRQGNGVTESELIETITRKRLFGLSRTCNWPAVEPLPAANESVDSIDSIIVAKNY
jgi:hypothetical protein